MAQPEVCRRAMYHLTMSEDRIVDKNGRPFSPEQYSRFKHGDAGIQRQYGHNLADFLQQTFPELMSNPTEKLLVAPFAYMYVPTAAGNLMEFFHQRIGWFRMTRNLPNVGRFHVHKEVGLDSHRADHSYAKLPMEQRLKILERSPLSTDAERVRGSTLIVIDDIIITGSAETAVCQKLLEYRPKKIIFLYVAAMDEEIARANPGMESVLNQWYVKGLDQMLEIMTRSDGYRLNLRNCKFILEHPTSEVQRMFCKLSDTLLEDLFQVCLANSYYLDPMYKKSIEAMQDELLRRGCLSALCPAGPCESVLRPSTPPL